MGFRDAGSHGELAVSYSGPMTTGRRLACARRLTESRGR